MPDLPQSFPRGSPTRPRDCRAMFSPSALTLLQVQATPYSIAQTRTASGCRRYDLVLLILLALGSLSACAGTDPPRNTASAGAAIGRVAVND